MGRATEAEQIEPSFRADVIRARRILDNSKIAALAAGFTIKNGKVFRADGSNVTL